MSEAGDCMLEAEEGGGLVQRACVAWVVVVCRGRDDGNLGLGFLIIRVSRIT